MPPCNVLSNTASNSKIHPKSRFQQKGWTPTSRAPRPCSWSIVKKVNHETCPNRLKNKNLSTHWYPQNRDFSKKQDKYFCCPFYNVFPTWELESYHEKLFGRTIYYDWKNKFSKWSSLQKTPTSYKISFLNFDRRWYTIQLIKFV